MPELDNYYHQLTYWHLATVIPAFILGAVQLGSRKGTLQHKILGRIYLFLMAATAIITLIMPARVGPSFFGHFGFIHLFSLLTLYVVPRSYWAARRGNIQAHRRGMIGLYVGGILLAGTFAFMPGRLLHQWLVGLL